MKWAGLGRPRFWLMLLLACCCCCCCCCVRLSSSSRGLRSKRPAFVAPQAASVIQAAASRTSNSSSSISNRRCLSTLSSKWGGSGGGGTAAAAARHAQGSSTSARSATTAAAAGVAGVAESSDLSSSAADAAAAAAAPAPPAAASCSEIYVTAPLFYSNGCLHLGHLYTAILADVTASLLCFFSASAPDAGAAPADAAAAAAGASGGLYPAAATATAANDAAPAAAAASCLLLSGSDQHGLKVLEAAKRWWSHLQPQQQQQLACAHISSAAAASAAAAAAAAGSGESLSIPCCVPVKWFASLLSLHAQQLLHKAGVRCSHFVETAASTPTCCTYTPNPLVLEEQQPLQQQQQVQQQTQQPQQQQEAPSHAEVVASLWRALEARGFIYRAPQQQQQQQQRHEKGEGGEEEADVWDALPQQQPHEQHDQQQLQQQQQQQQQQEKFAFFFALRRLIPDIKSFLQQQPPRLLPMAQQRELLHFLPRLRDIQVSRHRDLVSIARVFCSSSSSSSSKSDSSSKSESSSSSMDRKEECGVLLYACDCVWGLEVPGHPSHVVYVWLDALAAYLTPARSTCVDLALLPPPQLQLFGRDIARFHSVLFIAFLLALRHPPLTGSSSNSSSSSNGVEENVLPIERLQQLPVRQLAHGWLLRPSGHKLAKSTAAAVGPAAALAVGPAGEEAKGWRRFLGVAFSYDAAETEGALEALQQERLRFALLHCKAFERDLKLTSSSNSSSSSPLRAAARVLEQQVGNFAHRVLSLLQKQHEGLYPLPPPLLLHAATNPCCSSRSLAAAAAAASAGEASLSAAKIAALERAAAGTTTESSAAAAAAASGGGGSCAYLLPGLVASAWGPWKVEGLFSSEAFDAFEAKLTALAKPASLLLQLQQQQQQMSEEQVQQLVLAAAAEAVEAEDEVLNAAQHLLRGAGLKQQQQQQQQQPLQQMNGDVAELRVGSATAAAAAANTLRDACVFISSWRLLRASFLLPLLLRSAAQQQELHRYTRGIVAAAAAAQRLFEATAPWLAPAGELAPGLFPVVEALRRVALLLLPVCPSLASRLLQQLSPQPQQQQEQQQQRQQQQLQQHIPFSTSLAWGVVSRGGHRLLKPYPLLPPMKQVAP
ncbi:hypothetical protein Esti_004199 [Eimeria stiedai]